MVVMPLGCPQKASWKSCNLKVPAAGGVLNQTFHTRRAVVLVPSCSRARLVPVGGWQVCRDCLPSQGENFFSPLPQWPHGWPAEAVRGTHYHLVQEGGSQN